jgi:hypothetical protein
MAKKFVKISLATKFRVLFGAAVLGIIIAALVVPWYFMELLTEYNVQHPGAELTRMRLNEWLPVHSTDADAPSDIERHYTSEAQSQGRAGPRILRFSQGYTDPLMRDAVEAFNRDPTQLFITVLI